QAVARNGFADRAAGADERVGDGEGGKGTVGGIERGEQAVDHGGGDEGSRGVVDQDARRSALGGDGVEPVANREAAFGTADDGGGEVEALRRRFVERLLAFAYD